MNRRVLTMTRAIGVFIFLGLIMGLDGTGGLASGGAAGPGASEPLSIEEFLVRAARQDTAFEEILLEELTLAYDKILQLPAGDIVLSLKSQYHFLLSRDDEKAGAEIGLDKLFPLSGTAVAASYGNEPSLSTGRMRSDFHVMITQPVARNAFGRGTRLQEAIADVAEDLSRHQIVEAYEDYLAALMTVYYDWYSAHEELKISELSLQVNQRLLDNMMERSKQRIALPVDVNKVRLLVLAKEERRLQAQEGYDRLTRAVHQAVRYEGSASLEPVEPFGYHQFTIDFETEYDRFTVFSRTYAILDLLREKIGLTAAKSADDLLPSANVLAGYKIEGEGWRVQRDEALAYVGVAVGWPIGDAQARAQHAVSLIDQRRQEAANQTKDAQLYTDLKNIYFRIKREEALIRLSEERIALAESVLTDETRNYSYGKISLNDYIDAVNKLDEFRFQKITHAVALHQFMTEWLRLTDRLVGKEVLKSSGAARTGGGL